MNAWKWIATLGFAALGTAAELAVAFWLWG